LTSRFFLVLMLSNFLKMDKITLKYTEIYNGTAACYVAELKKTWFYSPILLFTMQNIWLSVLTKIEFDISSSP
jgi:hypothetical protein